MRFGKATRLATVAATVSAAACGAVVCASSANASASTISGIVHDQQGQAVSGAAVQLNAFAVDKAGVHEISIENATTDASGQYALPAPAASQIASLTAIDSGTFNYEVDVTWVSNGVIQSSTTTLPASAAFGATASARSAARLPASGRVNLIVTPLHAAGGKLAKASAISRLDCTNNYPTWKAVSTGTYQVIIGEMHDYINMWTDYTYTTGATTTVGVALSTSGSGGPFSENGSASSTNSGSSSVATAWSPLHYAPYVYGTFEYAEQQESFNCTGPSNNYRVVPQFWTGGTNISGNLTQYDGSNSPIWKNDQAHGGQYEANQSINTTFTRSSGSGANYSGGVSFAGIGLSSDTSFSGSVVYNWKMDGNTSNPHFLFGADGWPAYTSNGPSAQIIYSN